MHPGILAILAGALVGLMDTRNRVKSSVQSKIDALHGELEAAQTKLDEARELEPKAARVDALESERDQLKRELDGLKAGEAARKEKPPKTEHAPAPDETSDGDGGDE